MSSIAAAAPSPAVAAVQPSPRNEEAKESAAERSREAVASRPPAAKPPGVGESVDVHA